VLIYLKCIGDVFDIFGHVIEYIFTWNLFILYPHGRAHEWRVLICLKYIGDIFDIFGHVIEYIHMESNYLVFTWQVSRITSADMFEMFLHVVSYIGDIFDVFGV